MNISFTRNIIVLMISIIICTATELPKEIEDETEELEDVPPEPENAGVAHRRKNSIGEGPEFAHWKPGDKDNIWERSGFLEGDIMVAKQKKKKENIEENLRWPEGIVPYSIEKKYFS